MTFHARGPSCGEPRWFAAAVLSIPLLAVPAGPALGQANAGLIHKAKIGDTYASLAERFYGRRFLERHLRQMNRHAEPLKAGTPVIIPTLRRVRVNKNQSLRDFAAVHLQDPERATYLQVLNRLEGNKVEVGNALLVGESLRHVVRPGETFESIARTYYRNVSKRRLRLLRLYNKMPRGQVRPKMALRIPLDSTVFLAARVKSRAAAATAPAPPPPPARSVAAAANVTPAAPVAKAKPPPAPRRPAPKAQPTAARAKPRASKSKARATPSRSRFIEEALERAERRLADGEYADSLKIAVDALARHGTKPIAPRVELMRVKAVAQVALDQPAAALKTFETLLKLDPSYRLDLYSTSPKVLDIFQSIDDRSD